MISRALRVLALLGLGWLLSRLFRQIGSKAQGSSPPRRGPDAAPRVDGEMVRDRICNTFLPRSRAIRALVDGNEHFFCSTECRDRFHAIGGAGISQESRGRG